MFQESRLCHTQQHSVSPKEKIKDLLHSDRSVGHVLTTTDVELLSVMEIHTWNRMNSARRNGKRNANYEINRIAREDLESKGLVLKNKIELKCRGTAIPDFYSSIIGRKNVDTGEFESFFKVDAEKGNTAEFDRFRENVTLLEKEHTVFSRETIEGKNVIDYYVPYDIQESSKNRPTVTDEFPENAYLTEGYYECEYELLLTCGEATRRLVIPQRTVNVPMISLLSNIEDEIRDILDGFPDEDNNFADVLELMDDCYVIKMFDACGMPANIEINHAADFVNMIVSARQIKCEFKYGEEQ